MENLTKKCSTCKTDKPRDSFNKYAQAKDGLQPRCRDCQRERRVEWYAANRESEIAKARAWNLANPERVRAIDKARNVRNPEARRQSSAKNYANNGHRWIATKSALRTLDPIPFRESEKVWRAANKDNIRAKHERELAKNPNLSRDRYWKDPAYARQKTAKRRAIKRGATIGIITPESLAARIAFYGGKCWMCGDPYTDMDHVKPLSKGGAHMLANLRPACAPCNSIKSDKWPYSVAAS